jgi:hypothetical protein
VPYGCKEGHLIGRSRFWGVSHGSCIRVDFGDFAKLNPLRTVGVARLMGCTTVGAANRGVSAGWALFANRKSAWMLLSLMEVCTDCTARIVPAQGSWMTVGLTLTTLGAPPVCNVVVQLALAVADNQVLTANLGFLDVACERHDNRRICLMFSSVSWCKPPWGLTLNQLGIVGGDAQ